MRVSMQESFDNIRKALDIRERLLTRQAEVVLQSSQTKDKIKFLPENEKNVLHQIRIFGNFNVNVHRCDFLSNEDYEEVPVLMDKQLIDDDDSEAKRVDDKDVDSQMVDENANKINESLINIILIESKELIEKPAKTTKTTTTIPKALTKKHSSTSHQLSSKQVQIDTVNKGAVTTNTGGGGGGGGSKKKFSSLKNLTMNSGTLNLRNITNLTITNNCRPTAINSTTTTTTTDYDVQALACNNFYNRLINENKLLQSHRHSCCKPMGPTSNNNSIVSPTASSTSSTSFKEFSSGIEKDLMDKMISQNNWEMDVNGNLTKAPDAKPMKKMDRPKQIQHWLKQIINESELEPMQNTDMMEFSRIKAS